MRARTTIAIGSIALLTLVLAACGGATNTTASPAAGSAETIDITMTDALRFEPSTVEVQEGDTVTFVVSNPTAIDHEFAVGDAATMDMMDSDMMTTGMGGMDHGMAGASVPVPAGETADMTVTFKEAGTIPFTCHLNAHDEAGMTGTITVS